VTLRTSIVAPEQARQEEGFTLLELVIAMLVLSVAIGGLFGVFTTAFRSTAIDVHRTDATAIATKAMAQLEVSPNPVSGPLPGVTRNSETYAVSGVVAGAQASNGDPNAYTALAVIVTWTDQGGAHTLRQSSARYPSPTSTTTAVGCPPVLASPPIFNSPTSGDPSLDVSWLEPTGGPPVIQWQVQVSPDGPTGPWTTAIADEPPLPPGAVHQVEIGGLAATDAYAVQVVALSGCTLPQAFPASPGTTPATPGPTGSGCTPGSFTLGPPVVTRSPTGPPPGALTTDITVVVTTPSHCPSGFWVGAQAAAAGPPVTVALTRTSVGKYSYAGTLAGMSEVWDLGLHQVELFTGLPSVGPLPTDPIATAVICVEQEGASSC
jgi:prepilin-type N-terminal cleavage/methylation domain-containing protein